ncbi:MAG: hypothetical protein EON90_06320 [Brevundimonas sp.]|nr:MAG: hypothetical protein EON90_06320 [Brevundimonas sp.]
MVPFLRLSETDFSAAFPVWDLAANCGVRRNDMITADASAPIIRTHPDGAREVILARWGMPSPGRDVRAKAVQRAYHDARSWSELDFEAFAARQPDGGTPFIDASAQVWRPTLEPQGRCVVPFSSFGRLQDADGSTQLVEDCAPAHGGLGYLAGVHEIGWRGVRKSEIGPETIDLFGLVSVERIVQSERHRRPLTPIILADDAEVETWLRAPWRQAKSLRRIRRLEPAD